MHKRTQAKVNGKYIRNMPFSSTLATLTHLWLSACGFLPSSMVIVLKDHYFYQAQTDMEIQWLVRAKGTSPCIQVHRAWLAITDMSSNFGAAIHLALCCTQGNRV